MKFLLSFILCFSLSFSFSQSLPIDFEGDITTQDFVDFDGGIAEVIPNPISSGINTSATVAKITRDGGAIWGGSKIELAENLDFTSQNVITMNVYTTAPIGTTVKFKLEGDGETERDAQTTVSGEWETLSWDFTGAPSNFNTIVFMFDFGNVGNGSESSTFFFDDIGTLFGGLQIDLPVDFETEGVNFTVTDFGGNQSSLVTDPTNPANTVIQSIKTEEAATWAGTTIGTPAGFATFIPLTLTNSIMTVSVWSPKAGTPIRLKVEDANDPTHTCETETNTTKDGEWETIEFDFTNQAPGTESLSVGLSMGWKYNMASIFFNFGTEGADAGAQTYYFDNVIFGGGPLNTVTIENGNITVFPNPSTDVWNIYDQKNNIQEIKIYNQTGQLVEIIYPDNKEAVIQATQYSSGVYLARIKSVNQTQVITLLKTDR